MKKTFLFVVFLLFIWTLKIYSQDKNKGEFVVPFNEYWEQLSKEIQLFEEKPKEEQRVFKMDFTGLDLPKSLSEFTYFWHNEPLSQGRTGTCWAFSTTSFFESEIYRIHKKKLKLSVMYTVYWEYVEKAKRFVRERGNSVFGEGSEANAVKRIWKQYGIVPYEDYTGLLPGQTVYDHSRMFLEMNSYLENVKKLNFWNEEEVVSTIKSILNHYMTEPPTQVVVEGEKITPLEYLNDYLRINVDDYIDILSYMQEPYWQQVEYKVPDNWWHSKDYYNIPLDDFINVLKQAIKNGYTIALGGDVSEAGYDSRFKVAIVPTFDIPSQYIDENARQFRFSNQTTTDDHGIHLVGYTTKNGIDWFLIKDSGAGSKNVEPRGYYFYHEDYIKLKMMDYMVHKDAASVILEKFNK
ncbi:MAG: C1 family peptidase [Ignavibacteria bacterium]